jgi:uncharacterized protein (TIGR04255 family)
MVTARPADLPDFSNPPVVETVFSVQFDRLSAFRTAHFGLYWSEVRNRFPTTEEHGEIPAVVERSPEQLPPAVGIQFQALETPPTPRFWFIDKRRAELLQVQKDRFVKNWRKAGEGDLYPRYEQVRAGFDIDFNDFTQFVSRNQLGTIRINQCEVTYINHIVAGAGWETHADVDKVLNVWAQPTSAYPGRAQDMTFHARFPMLDQDGQFVGRLNVSFRPVNRISDGAPMFLLELTARGQLGEGTEFFDLGREWIVRSFAELTTPAMHEIWGRRK